MTGQQIRSSEGFRDTQWHTQTCKLGWSVHGIWDMKKYNDGTDINHVDANFAMSLLAVADDKGLVSLFSYPTVKKNSAGKHVNGHCSHVTRVRFTDDNKHLISAGGGDLTLIQHKIL